MRYNFRYFQILLVFLLSNYISIYGQPARVLKNPVLEGFYPDPSICRVDDDYYLVCSSNEYFPGIPLFHSKDLVNWEQLGHVLDRPSQVSLEGIKPSGGIFAPTIRYHDGIFYVACTRSGGDPKKRNFIVTAKNPAGPWSEPFWLENAEGIDPSLFFDEDGRVWYTGNRTPEGGEKYPKQREIWLQEFNLKKMELTGPVTILLEEGAVRQARNPEAPHIYKVDGYYYLIIAEGGTDFTHAATVFRSKNIAGTYEIGARNPIITSRHLGSNYPIQCIGHADFVETQKGDWYTVVLGTRPYGGRNFANLARETFIAPVVWEDGWPVVAPGEGKMLKEFPAPNLPEFKVAQPLVRDNFNTGLLNFQWNMIRTPKQFPYSLSSRKGYLRLFLKSETVAGKENPAFVGRRQQHMNFEASTLMEFNPRRDYETAGLMVYQNPEYHFKLEYLINKGNKVLRLSRVRGGETTILTEKVVDAERLYLKVAATGQDYSFHYSKKDGDWQLVADKIDGRMLNRSTAGGFTGVYLAMYASSNGHKSTNYADFDWFDYQSFPVKD